MQVPSLQEYGVDLWLWRCPFCGRIADGRPSAKGMTYDACRHWAGLVRVNGHIDALFEDSAC